MDFKKKIIIPDGHKPPTTRRDFLKYGIIPFAGYVIAPNFLTQILFKNIALAADVSGACGGVAGTGYMPFLVFDISTGKTLLEKNADTIVPVASLTKLMTAIVAHEVVYLARSITVTDAMLAGLPNPNSVPVSAEGQLPQPVSSHFYPKVGTQYVGLDLLYPLLVQSSNASAKALAGFTGEGTFVRNMNAKAASLAMADSRFADTSGISAGNTATAHDIAKLLQYIYFKRPFLFDIGKGMTVENVGFIKVGDTIDIKNLKNFNEFVDEPDLVGVKNGETTAARQTMATVWNIHTASGTVPVAIVVLGSEYRKQAT